MTTIWNADQVIALAPDPASAKAGRGLATPGKWEMVGADEQMVWGACKGSAATPYQTIIDLAGPTFTCSCPSRKFPCKHGLGLLLLYAAEPARFGTKPPTWVGAWQTKRATKQATKQRTAEPVDAATQAKRATQEAKRAAGRQDRVAAGLDDLSVWLQDLMRQGLADTQRRSLRFWLDAAARLVDAQAPGAGRLVRELGMIPNSGDGWPERLLEHIGLLHLGIEGYRRIGELPEATQADIRTLVGWTYEQADLAADAGINDQWLVLGQQMAEEERFTVERTWLHGLTTGRSALHLHFAPHNQPGRSGIIVGMQCAGCCNFYPSAYPLRASLQWSGAWAAYAEAAPAGLGSLPALLEAYAVALSRQPWIERVPALLDAVVPVWQDETWLLRDATGGAVPLHAHWMHGWQLLALSGGHPLPLFGEWDGTHLWPLSVWTDGHLIPLGGA